MHPGDDQYCRAGSLDEWWLHSAYDDAMTPWPVANDCSWNPASASLGIDDARHGGARDELTYHVRAGRPLVKRAPGLHPG